MVTEARAPMLPPHRSRFEPLGFPFSTEMTEEEFLKARFPQSLLRPLETIVRRMGTEVFQPLLYTADSEELRKEFARLFNRFSDLYFSMLFLLSSAVPNVSELFLISAPAFAFVKREFDRRGGEIVGEGATNDLLVGLGIVSIVNRRLMKLMEAEQTTEANERAWQGFQSWLLAYMMSTLCVWHYFCSNEGLRQNARVAAYWSRYFAAGMYQSAKDVGLLSVPIGVGREAEPDEEDLRISDVGVQDFITRLSKEETE